MLNVSSAWQNASREQFRYQAYLYASLKVVPPGIREGASVESEHTSTLSNIAVLNDDIVQSPTKYATLEPNRWVLDGTFKLLDEDTKVDDWWSQNAVSSTQPTIKFTFNQAYTIPGIYFIWDKENDTWPSSITVIGYSVNHEQKYTVTVDNISSSSGFINALAMDDVKYIDIIINSWSFDNWRARLVEITFGFVDEFNSVNNGRIQSATQISKADPLNTQLPTHNMDIVLRNYDNYFDATLNTSVSKYIAQQQVVKVQWAFTTSKENVEYAPEQVYLVEKISVPADSKEVTLNLTSRLNLLDSEFYYGTYTNSKRTLYDIAQYVLSNSGALTEYSGQEPWVIPDVLKSISTSAPIPSGATNAILQLIALASCTWLTTRSTDGFIQFRESDFDVNQYCAVDEMQELGNPSITVNDRLRSVSIGVYNYTPRATKETVGNGKYELQGTNVVVLKYTSDYATEVSAAISGATLVSATYYASYAVLTISASDSGATVTVTLTGKIIDTNISYFEVYRDHAVVDGKDVTIENPFITELSNAKLVAEYVKNYYLKRSEYSIPYIGYPQAEPVDKINLKTTYGSSVVELKSNTIDFNGGWSGSINAI